ncbi:cuticle protein 8-like [Zophobas morio]|uniref:cuticle protein 8-like n=1 Tax=Zophobas morio TaxID=2755281 RepID=UPI003082AB1D
MAARSLIIVAIIGTSLAQSAPSVPFSLSFKRVQLPLPSPAQEKITQAILPQPTAVPNYDYNYVVRDPHSGDAKSQQESRQGDVVKGRYEFVEADGSRRIVEYFADPVRGFNAVVKRVYPNRGGDDLSNELLQV